MTQQLGEEPAKHTPEWPAIRVLDMDEVFMFGLVRNPTPEESAEAVEHGRPADFPVSMLGIDSEGCACVDGKINAERLATCWNACAGMANPAEEIERLKAAAEFRWRKEYPNEQCLWWHWNGDEDSMPYPVEVMYSGTTGGYFVAMGQHGWNHPQEFADMGGLWCKVNEPGMPSDAAIEGAASTV